MDWDTEVLRGTTASSLLPSHSLHPCCILQSLTSAVPQIPGLQRSLAAVTSCAFPGLLNFAAQIFAGPQAPSFPESQIPRHPFYSFSSGCLLSSLAPLCLFVLMLGSPFGGAGHLPSPIGFQEPHLIGSLSTLLPLLQAPPGCIFPAYSVLAVPRPMSSLLDCPQFCLLPHSSG